MKADADATEIQGDGEALGGIHPAEKTKKDPKQKLEQRKRRQTARSKTRLDEAKPRTRLDEAAGANKREAPRREGHERSRCIPSSVRERLLERAGYQCEYRGPGGVRCTARTRLEVDHIVPIGKGGSRGEENLRVFCRGHNLLSAAREFGEEFMRGKIEGRKSKQSCVRFARARPSPWSAPEPRSRFSFFSSEEVRFRSS